MKIKRIDASESAAKRFTLNFKEVSMEQAHFFPQFLTALSDIHRSMALNVTQQSAVRNAVHLFKPRGANLMLFNPGNQTLEISASFGLSPGYLAKGEVSPTKSLGEMTLRAPVLIRDVASDPNIQYREAAVKEGIRSILGLPMTAGSLLVGSLRLYFEEMREIQLDEMAYLQAFTDQIGMALRKAYFFQSMRTSASEIHHMPSFSLKEALATLVASAARSGHASGCAMYLINKRDQTLEKVSSFGLSERYLAKGPVSVERSLGEVNTGQPVVIANVPRDSRIQYQPEAAAENIKAIIGLPVRAGQEIVGAVRWYFPIEFEPDADDLAWMDYLANHVGMALEKNQLLIRMKDQRDWYVDVLGDMDQQPNR